MNKMRNVFAAVSLVLFACTASGVATIPVPILEDQPLRVGAQATASATFSPFALQRLDGILGAAYAFGGGFEGGFNFRAGGIACALPACPGGQASPMLFDSAYQTDTVIGGDMVLRYLGNVTEFGNARDSLYLGLQAQVGYDYTFNQNSIATASNVTAAVGVPLGIIFGSVAVYVMPEIDFGRRLSTTDGVFGSAVGLGGAVGTYISFGMVQTYLEVKPKSLNISDSSATNFAMDATLGLALEI
jgi:hypothetical protein